MFKAYIYILTLLGSAFAAKTDLAGCSLTVVPLLTEIVTTTVNGVVSSFGDYAETTFQWDGTEQCQLLDCGGGRAPPKTGVPGCPGYTGTDTVPSIPFPTASLTLNQDAATSATAAPSSDPSSSAISAPATPIATSSSPLASNTGLPVATQSTSSPVAGASSGSPPPTVTTGSASQASDLNPTTKPNGASHVGGRWVMVFPGLLAVAVAALHWG